MCHLEGHISAICLEYPSAPSPYIVLVVSDGSLICTIVHWYSKESRQPYISSTSYAGQKTYDFSSSGVKTAVRSHVPQMTDTRGERLFHDDMC